MSYYEVTVKVKVGEASNLIEILAWIHKQGWKEIVEWRWFRLDEVDRKYNFQFDDPKHAEWFALRWS